MCVCVCVKMHIFLHETNKLKKKAKREWPISVGHDVFFNLLESKNQTNLIGYPAELTQVS